MDELTRILDTAEGLFLKYGIRSVTMADISEALGMSKKTIYLYIENKDDLIAKSLLRSIDRDKVQIEATSKEAINALDELMKMNIEVQQKIQEINPILIYDLKKYHSQSWAYFEKFQRDFIYGCILNNLQRGISEGIYRQDIHPDILSKIYIGFFPVFTDYDLFPVQEYPRLELHREFMLYHLHGIVSEKGRELLKAYTIR